MEYGIRLGTLPPASTHEGDTGGGASSFRSLERGDRRRESVPHGYARQSAAPSVEHSPPIAPMGSTGQTEHEEEDVGEEEISVYSGAWVAGVFLFGFCFYVLAYQVYCSYFR